jgi:hypothetical protein
MRRSRRHDGRYAAGRYGSLIGHATMAHSGGLFVALSVLFAHSMIRRGSRRFDGEFKAPRDHVIQLNTARIAHGARAALSHENQDM